MLNNNEGNHKLSFYFISIQFVTCQKYYNVILIVQLTYNLEQNSTYYKRKNSFQLSNCNTIFREAYTIKSFLCFNMNKIFMFSLFIINNFQLRFLYKSDKSDYHKRHLYINLAFLISVCLFVSNKRQNG